MLTNDELLSMRATVNTTLVETCTISRPGASTLNEYGEMVPGDATTTTTDCKVTYLGGGGGEQVRAQRLASERPWTVKMPYGTDVKLQDQILVNDKTLEVAEIIQGKTWDISTTVMCKELI